MIGNVGTYYDVLTYQYNTDIPIGTIVNVPIGKKASLGVVAKKVPQPDFTCKPITKIILDHPIPSALIKLHDWMADYYATSSGIVWQTILPSRIAVNPRKKACKTTSSTQTDKRTQILLNKTQSDAVQRIRQINDGTILLHGITGSGKTEVYKTIAQDTVDNGKSVILLVPEISLTTQLVQQFQNQFNDVVEKFYSATSHKLSLDHAPPCSCQSII